MLDRNKKYSEEIAALTKGLNISGKSEKEIADQAEQIIERLWHVLEEFQGEVFYTAKKLEYQYTIKGGEMFVSRREKTITKATIVLAAKKAITLQMEGKKVDGPKKLGVYGASYIWPVFKEIGIILD